MTDQNLVKTSRGMRFLAFLIDAFGYIIVGLVIMGVFMMISEDLAKVVTGIYLIAYVVLCFVLMVKRSQSVGKFLLNIYVYDKKEKKRMSFVKYWLLREVLGKTLVVGGLPFIGLLFGPIYFLIDSFMIFRKDMMTAHDMIAGSLVCNLPDERKRKGLFDFKTL